MQRPGKVQVSKTRTLPLEPESKRFILGAILRQFMGRFRSSDDASRRTLRAFAVTSPVLVQHPVEPTIRQALHPGWQRKASFFSEVEDSDPRPDVTNKHSVSASAYPLHNVERCPNDHSWPSASLTTS
jgi:hypothetical protein